jgi:hypothetical protein
MQAVNQFAKRTIKIQWNRMRDNARVVRELGIGSRLSATHVVSSCGLRPPLQKAYKEKDLPFGYIGKCIPSGGEPAAYG